MRRDEDLIFRDLFALAIRPASLLLPISAILLVTREWSQRTALITFTLVPERERVMAAKVLAVVVFALVISLNCLLLGVIGTLISPGTDAWNSGSANSPRLLLHTLGILIAFGIGAALMSSAPAIVLSYVLPIVFAIWPDIPASATPRTGSTRRAPSEAL